MAAIIHAVWEAWTTAATAEGPDDPTARTSFAVGLRSDGEWLAA